MTDSHNRHICNLIDKVNRFRSQGWKYNQIKEKLVKMGNAPVVADEAISAYVEEMCGVSQKRSSRVMA